MRDCNNISLADTAGHAKPDQVRQMFKRSSELDADVECTCHFHNTYGMGMANCYAAMKVGCQVLRILDCRTRRLSVHKDRRRQCVYGRSRAYASADGIAS